jgi:hypothetical protein
VVKNVAITGERYVKPGSSSSSDPVGPDAPTDPGRSTPNRANGPLE